MEILRSLAEKVDPRRAAVLVIDMQNDFCSEGGFIHRLGFDLTRRRGAIERIAAFLEQARAAGVPVMHARYDGDPTYFDAPMLERLERKNEAEPYCMPGTWGIEFVPQLQPLANEAVINKHRYSAFFGTELDMLLSSAGIDTLILAGAATNNCVDGTGRDAFYNGYYVVVLSDGTTCATDELQRATLATVDHAYGVVATIDEVVATWNSSR